MTKHLKGRILGDDFFDSLMDHEEKILKSNPQKIKASEDLLEELLSEEEAKLKEKSIANKKESSDYLDELLSEEEAKLEESAKNKKEDLLDELLDEEEKTTQKPEIEVDKKNYLIDIEKPAQLTVESINLNEVNASITKEIKSSSESYLDELLDEEERKLKEVPVPAKNAKADDYIEDLLNEEEAKIIASKVKNDNKIYIKKVNNGVSYELENLDKIVYKDKEINKFIIEIKKEMKEVKDPRNNNESFLTPEENLMDLDEIQSNSIRYSEIKSMISQLIASRIGSIIELSTGEKATILDAFKEYIVRQYFDYGLLYDLIKRPTITNVSVQNGVIFYTEVGSKEDKNYNEEKNLPALTVEEVEILTNKILRNSDMLNDENPSVDTIMEKNGYRVSAVIHKAASSYTNVISIRKPNHEIDFSEYLEQGYFPDNRWAKFFEKVIERKRNFGVSGPTGSGKTTFLKTLIKEFYPKKKKLIALEDTAELNVDISDSFVAFYVKNKEKYRMEDRFKDCLRQQPRAIIVGEIREGEAAYYTAQAGNTGHDAISFSIHSSGAREAVTGRFKNMLKQSKAAEGYKDEVLNEIIRKTVRYVFHVGQVEMPDGTAKFMLLEVLRVDEEDPAEGYLRQINRIQSEIANLKELFLDSTQMTPSIVGLPQLLLAEIETIKIEMDKTPIKTEYFLKYNRDTYQYDINRIDELMKRIEENDPYI